MTAALIIASGRTNSKTHFEPGKVIGSIPVVERVILLLQQAGIQQIVVVCDENNKIRKLRLSANVTFLSASPEGEMLDNVKKGLSYLCGRCTEAFYDNDVHQLLSLTEELGSLSKACVHMGISLNKGRTIISVIEQQIGHPALETQQGGPKGGYSRLTPEMKAMMTNYQAFCTEAEDVLKQLFQKHFLSKTDAQ